uniref:DNA damage-inducible transcript 4 protein n=1 Tax=Kryptolebias marmoratus TaxID=37003 RepID=A0A3Q3BHD1_KRYMA
FCLLIVSSLSLFPPSPAEDRGSRSLSWSNLLLKLTELKGDKHKSCLLLCASDTTFFCYPPEETLAAEVVATITQSLNNASHMLCCSRLLLPDRLMQSLSQELLHLAVNEPCGLRGALIDLCVERGDQGPLCPVDQIAVDPTLVPTFHMTLVLRMESGGLWPKVQKLFKGGKPPPATSPRHRTTLKLSTSFRAIKRKLYSSGELLIEEC